MKRYWIKGIDVSHYQGDINWGRVAKDRIRFAVAKATQGTAFVDPMFTRNWHGARAAGLVRGAYHFLDAAGGGQAQANHYMSTVRSLGGWRDGDLPPILDFETGSREQARDFIDRVKATTDEKVILYSGNYLREHGGGNLGASYLWLPAYVAEPTPDAYLPRGWDTWTIWQYGAGGRVNGIIGPCDVDVFHGGKIRWKRFLKEATKR